MPEGSATAFVPHGRCSVIVTDIVGYGGFRTPGQQRRIREKHYGMLEGGLADAGIEPGGCYWEDRGDGILLAVPPEVPPLLLLTEVLGNLQYRLRACNLAAGPGERIRLRVGLHAGEAHHDGRGLTGTDVNLVFRLIDSRGLKERLRESTKALAFVTSDEVYRTVVKTAPPPVDPDEFTALRVREKETAATAWYQLRGRAEPGAPAVAGSPVELCPYPGLTAFGLDDARWFFGRGQATADLLERLSARLENPGPLVVVGPSGVGKSSLLRAGLLHGARDGRLGVPGSGEWRRVVFTPTADLAGDFAALLAGLAGIPSADPPPPPSAEALLEARTALAGRSEGAEDRIVLVVDQLEAMFTLCPDREQHRAFVEALVALASPREGGPLALVVLGLRADFLGRCMAFPELVRALGEDTVFLEPMTAAELREAIELPARAADLEVEAGLVEVLLHDLGVGENEGYDPGALPLLAHALRATWRQGGGRALGLDAYHAAGGVEGAIAKSAERVYRDLDEPGKEIARRLLLRMIKISEDAETPRRESREGLLQGSVDAGAAASVLEALAEARLVILDETTAEISHDALLREWPQLREWIDANRAGLLIGQRLDDAAGDWERGGRHPSDLLRSPRLAIVQGWAETEGASLAPLAGTFLDASAAAERRELTTARSRARRLRYLLSFVCVLLVFAAATGAVALREQRTAARERTEAQSRQLAGAATVLTESQPETALLLSVQAFRVHASPEARDRLLSTQAHYLSERLATEGPAYAVAYRPDGRGIAGADSAGVRVWDEANRPAPTSLPAGAYYGLAYAPDGRTLAASGQNGSVVLADQVTGEVHVLVDAARARGPAGAVAYSRDGHLLAAAGHDGTVRVWDAASRREVMTLTGGLGAVESIAFSPDGRRLAGATADSAVLVWALTPGAVARRLTGHVGPVRSVAFSPDGRTVASGGDEGAVRLWDAATGEVAGSLRGHIGPVRSVVFSPGGALLASGGDDASVRLWDVASRSPLTQLSGPSGPVAGLAFSPSGGTLAAAGADSSIGLWRLGPLGPPDHGRPGGAAALVMARDGRPLLASTDGSGPIRLWDVISGRLLHTLGAGGVEPGVLAFNATGTALAAADGERVAVWDLGATGPPGRPRTTRSPEAVRALAFSPDGRTLALGSGRTLRLWPLDRRGPTTSRTPHPSPINAVAFSPDGALVATGSDDRTVSLTRVGAASGGPSDCSGHSAPVRALAFGPSGGLLASASADHTVKLWSLRDRCRLVRTFTGHAQGVVAVAVSADGTRIADVGEEGFIDLWNLDSGTDEVTSGRRVASLTGFSGASALVFGTGRDTLVSAGPSGRPQLWDTDTARVAARICAPAPAPPPVWTDYVQPGLAPPCPRRPG
ncbi:AAA family ATPase [Actinocorallia longicatena]|uniref:Novel STAND NTPase 1 domain-containing protein n=1 Tax=Actinocorallia longicatena TaxID=111803 RepID=A0ABP6QG51_9ACTN